VGEANANLLGSMLITKIYLAAMSRADVQEKELQKLPNFYLYVDEFQSFANESFADILSEARKYKLNLTIAHQYIEQMSEEVRAAVFGNVGTMITFRVGAFDAEILEKEFAPQFTAEDLVNLGFAQIYLKLMIDGVSSTPFSATTMPPIKEPEVSHKQDVIDMSRKQFAMARAGVEQDVIDWHSNKSQNNVAPIKKAEIREERKPEVKVVETKEAVPVVKPPVKVFEKPKYVKREEPRVIPPPLEEVDDDFVPLKELKPQLVINNTNNNGSGKKVVNEKSLADLRAVLQSLNKNKVSGSVETPARPNITVPKVETSIPEKPKEIPEDKLKQILQVNKN
jgi:hypothetical protein